MPHDLEDIKPNLFSARFIEVDRAIVQLFEKGVNEEDFPLIERAFHQHNAWDIRTDLVDLIARMAKNGHPEAIQFLIRIAKGRYHFRVRYWAMMNLIDLQHDEWRPTDLRKRRSDFYLSLDLYDQFIKGEISLAEVHHCAKERLTYRGDHWEWLTHLSEGGRWAKT